MDQTAKAGLCGCSLSDGQQIPGKCPLNYKLYASFLEGDAATPQPPHSCFAMQLAARFPHVAARIDEDDFGSLHLEVATMSLATLEAIKSLDWTTVESYFVFMSDLLARSTQELHDAIHASYLANLLFGKESPDFAKARALMPHPLSDALSKIEARYAGV